MNVWMEEEHGYADYIWTPPYDNQEELTEWWDGFDKSKIDDLVFGTWTNEEEIHNTERR